MDLRGCCASAVDAVFTFRWRNRPDVSVPVRAPTHDHVIPQLLSATESLTIVRRCLRRIGDFLHPPRLQPWLQAICAGDSPHRSCSALSAGCEWLVSMLDLARDSILAARTALHSSEQFRLNRFEECSEWRCMEGCTVPPNMHVDVIVHNQRILLLAWLLQPLASKAAVGDSSMYKVGTAPEDAVGMHVVYRGMLHSISGACVAAETDSPHRDDGISGLERLLSPSSLVQVHSCSCSDFQLFLPYQNLCFISATGWLWGSMARVLAGFDCDCKHQALSGAVQHSASSLPLSVAPCTPLHPVPCWCHPFRCQRRIIDAISSHSCRAVFLAPSCAWGIC